MAANSENNETGLEGCFVEIVQSDSQPSELQNSIGKKGRVVRWDSEAEGYIVQTFSNELVSAPPTNVKAFEPGSFQDGGFDVAWPFDEEDSASFAAQVVQTLRERDFCVIQTFMDDESRGKAVKEASDWNVIFKPMKKDFQEGYLGKENKSKTSWLDSLPDEKEELETALDLYDDHLSNLSKFLLPLTPTAMDFDCFSRTNAMIRVPHENASDAIEMAGDEITEDDVADGLVDNHILFLRRRRLCMMFCIKSSGGTVNFSPRDADHTLSVPVTTGKLIVFRHDKMAYSYSGGAEQDVMLQAWVLTEPPTVSMTVVDADQKTKDEMQGLLVGPGTPDGNRISVVGMDMIMPGSAHKGKDSYWAMLAIGTDAQIRIPFTRYDIDVYYREGDAWTVGFTYTCHGGHVTPSIYDMDPAFFNMSDNEAALLSPPARHCLEVGYVAMYNGGFKREQLKGRKIGVYVGFSGDDWMSNMVYTHWAPHMEDKEVLTTGAGYSGRYWSSVANRLSYIFGMTGPQTLVDTACSSSLCAYGVGHTAMRAFEPGQNPTAISSDMLECLAMGTNMMTGPGGYTSLSGPHMLSAMGRCFTYDHSADGYERGEGSGAIMIVHRNGVPENALACVIGACLNQDGRSASMTAPNGPAQQECIRGSMREAGVVPNAVIAAECHGTGTALGDPIEVGALRGVMFDREVPLMEVSAKSHIGHLEASAGQAGVQKCIMMCQSCCGTPNCHLLSLNPHLDVNGYPTFFCTELSDYAANSGFSGVSSFGFGGANSRADVWARAWRGPHNVNGMDLEKLDYIAVTCPVDQGPIHYLDGYAVPAGFSSKFKRGPTSGGQYRADAIRDEFDNYEYSSIVYKGKYHREPEEEEERDENPGLPVYLVGSWSGFQQFDEMENETDNIYSCLVVLGDSRCEQFHIVLDQDRDMSIYPVVKNGSTTTRVVGPDFDRQGRNFLIDGRDQQIPAGSVYQVTFVFDDPMSISWERVETPPPELSYPCGHLYHIIASWTSMNPREMRPVQDCEGAFEVKVRLSAAGQEEFRFCRDFDLQQLIYPAGHRVFKTTVPVRGPDEFGQNKSWAVRGPPGEMVTVRIEVVDAHITVMVDSATKGVKVWESIEGPKRHQYFITSTFNNWGLDEMDADESAPGVFRYQGQVGEFGEEQFQIVLDEDKSLVYYPDAPDGKPGRCFVKGPDKSHANNAWRIEALKVGTQFEIIFDPHATDKREIVTVKWTSERVDIESMVAAFDTYYMQ